MSEVAYSPGARKDLANKNTVETAPIPMTAAPMASTANRMYPTAKIKSSSTATDYPSLFPASFATSTNTLMALFSSVRSRIISA